MRSTNVVVRVCEARWMRDLEGVLAYLAPGQPKLWHPRRPAHTTVFKKFNERDGISRRSDVLKLVKVLGEVIQQAGMAHPSRRVQRAVALSSVTVTELSAIAHLCCLTA